MTIDCVGVLGAGTMGAGIAEVALRAGLRTIVAEASDDLAERGRERILTSLARALSKGKLTDADHDRAVALLTVSHDLQALEPCDIVIEAIIEDYDLKAEAFRMLDKVLGPDAILATNTSSIPIIDLATVTTRPQAVLGLHFFNPAPVQPLIEVVYCLTTDDDVIARADTFARDQLGKHIIHTGDRAGFVVNRLLVPYLLSAIAMLDAGIATKEDIDNGMRHGCAHPMGPLELCDLIGLDTIMAVANVIYREYNEAHHAPPPLLKRMVAAGHLGRKSGRGFYTYAT